MSKPYPTKLCLTRTAPTETCRNCRISWSPCGAEKTPGCSAAFPAVAARLDVMTTRTHVFAASALHLNGLAGRTLVGLSHHGVNPRRAGRSFPRHSVGLKNLDVRGIRSRLTDPSPATRDSSRFRRDYRRSKRASLASHRSRLTDPSPATRDSSRFRRDYRRSKRASLASHRSRLTESNRRPSHYE